MQQLNIAGRLRGNSAVFTTALPIAAGAAVALVASAMMTWLKPLWIAFAVAGLLVMIGSFLVKDPIKYWLALFLLALPLNLRKNFMASHKVFDLVDTLGLTWGASTLMLYASDLALGVLVLLWIRRKIRTRERFYFPRIAFLPLGFLVWSTLGAFLSPFPTLSAFELIREYKFFAIFLLTINLVDLRKMGALILGTLFLGLAMQAGVTAFKYYVQSSSTLFGDTFGDESTRYVPNTTVVAGEEDRYRGEGTFGHPNVTSQHAELVAPFALLLLLVARNAAQRLAGLVFFSLGVATIYLTFSRGGMVAFLTAVCAALLVAWRRGLISRRSLVVIVCLAAVTAPYAATKLYSYLTTRPEAFDERFAHWNVGIDLAMLNPFMGTGLNTSTAIKQVFERKIGGLQIGEDNIPLHNHYLIALIEIGIVGTALYCGFFLAVAVRAFRLADSKELLITLFAIGILAIYCSTAAHMTIDLMSADGLHTLIWFYAGLIVSLGRTELRQDGAPARPVNAEALGAE